MSHSDTQPANSGNSASGGWQPTQSGLAAAMHGPYASGASGGTVSNAGYGTISPKRQPEETDLGQIYARVANANGRIVSLNSRVNDLIGRLYGEGETETQRKEAPRAAGMFGAVHAGFDGIESQLAYLEQRLSRLETLAP